MLIDSKGSLRQLVSVSSSLVGSLKYHNSYWYSLAPRARRAKTIQEIPVEIFVLRAYRDLRRFLIFTK